jgi:eukaryotic-like serine/threonine-protein kinase
MLPISPERWRTLSPYLDEVLDLPAEARAAWLASLSGRDPALGADIEALLREQDALEREGFLDGALLDPGDVRTHAQPGQVLGAYRLLSLIGQGGSGSVWLAERCDGRFQGRAAVKLLNPALLARFGEERFRREGSILASLRDPRIAHLIDAGLSPAGQPYLVLEYVNGQTIDHYCDERGLGVEPRLRLFLDVLEAVAHAHASLVVHRDIKPANVLVSTDGRVKLLDFGIAALLQQATGEAGLRGSDISAVSRELRKALTPEYAAPEQLSGGVITTATDVYALGVLLYVLMTGRHPASSAAGTPAALIRAILLGDVPRPSDVAPSQVRRALRGDLDAIMVRALARDPADRYTSVTAFADDIRRALRHEPVSARPDTFGYRGGRFARRNAAAVASLMAVALLVAGLTAVHTRRLAVERDRAQREAAKAIKVSEILTGLLTSADPYAARPIQASRPCAHCSTAAARRSNGSWPANPTSRPRS